MKIYGKVTFKSKSYSNQVTMEGVKSIISSLMNNDMAFISNILFITDESELQAITQNDTKSLASITWDDLYNNDNPRYNPSVVAGVIPNLDPESDSNYGKGSIVIAEPVATTIGEYVMRCNCVFSAGEWPSGTNTVLGMAIILNGSGNTMGNFGGSYKPTLSEKVLCFIKVNAQFRFDLDNEFSWEIYFNVTQ